MCTGSLLWDWLLGLLGRSGYRTNDLAQSGLARLTSTYEHCTADYPPTYISDGNVGTFFDMGKSFVAKLGRLGVDVEANFPPREEGKLQHIWELDMGLPAAQSNMRRTLVFMDERMR